MTAYGLLISYWISDVCSSDLACRHAGEAAEAGSGRQGDRAGLRARTAYRSARSVRGTGQQLAGRIRARHVRRPARFVEPQAAERLQGDLRAVQRRHAERTEIGRAHV